MTNRVQTLDSENHDLRWEAIRLHGLLASVHAPNSGRGVLLWTSRLTSCFESSPEFSEWLKESQKLRSLLLLQAFDTQEPVVQRELDDPIWTSVDNCMSAREAATRGHFWVDKLLAHGMTHIAAGLHYATAEFFNGMRMLYRSTRLNPKGTRGSQWSDVLNALTLQGPPLPLLIHRLPSGTSRDFAQRADRVLKLAIAAPSTTRDIQSIRKLIEVERARKAVQEDGPDFTAELARVEEVNDDRQGQTNSSADHLSSDGKPSADIPLHCDRSISEFLRSQARFNVSHPGARV